MIDFFLIGDAKSENYVIVRKFRKNRTQNELTFEGEERLFSYILVSLKAK